jgi:hypothetical protein
LPGCNPIFFDPDNQEVFPFSRKQARSNGGRTYGRRGQTIRPWAKLPIQRPQQCLEIPGREDHFVVSGEFVMLCEPVVCSIMFGNNEQVLHASVGRILHIEHNATG